MSEVSTTSQNKVELGQYYTAVSPFSYPRFARWLESIPQLESLRFVEPFAGGNSLVRMIVDGYPRISPDQWSSFDIEPEAQGRNLMPEVVPEKRDTLQSYPTGFDVAITNPPYLAKNSATRMRLETEFGPYQDLFELALAQMLAHTPRVAAIIPESFITRKIFTDRLEFVISLNHEMFADTEFPVCLAVFDEASSEDFEIWRGGELLGTYKGVIDRINPLLTSAKPKTFRFNDPKGQIGIWAIDDTQGPTIRFLDGNEIAPHRVKNTSRSFSRIYHPIFDEPGLSNKTIQLANEILREYRNLSQDVFLTSFKGLRADGRYRRRIDWGTTSDILATCLQELRSLESPDLLRPDLLRLF